MKKQISQLSLIGGLTLISSSALQAQFVQANAQEAAGYAVSLEQGLTAVQSAADFAIANARKAQTLTAGYDFANVETASSGARLFEGDIDQSAMHLNYGHAFGDLIASVQVSLFDSEAESNYSDGGLTGDVELDSDGWFVASTLAYQWGEVSAVVIAGLGKLSNDSTRISAAIAAPKTGDFDTEFYTLGINVDYTIYQANNIIVTPRIGLNYTNVEVDSFSESIVGPVLDRGELDSIDRDWFIGSVEVLFGWDASEALTLHAVLGWHYDFNADDVELSGTDSGVVAGQIEIPGVGESYFKGGLSANYAINENWSLGATTSLLSGDELDGFSIGASLGYSF